MPAMARRSLAARTLGSASPAAMTGMKHGARKPLSLYIVERPPVGRMLGRRDAAGSGRAHWPARRGGVLSAGRCPDWTRRPRPSISTLRPATSFFVLLAPATTASKPSTSPCRHGCRALRSAGDKAVPILIGPSCARSTAGMAICVSSPAPASIDEMS